MQERQSLHWESQVNDGKITLQLSGELSRNTLLPLWQQRASFFIGRTIEWANYSLGFDSNNPYRLRRFCITL